MSTTTPIDRFLDIDTERFTAPMAEALVHFKVTEEVNARVEELAEKSNFGTISEQERAEYLRLIELAEVFSLLQARAKRFLDGQD